MHARRVNAYGPFHAGRMSRSHWVVPVIKNLTLGANDLVHLTGKKVHGYEKDWV